MDIARIRSETPGCRNMLHFNSAGSALMAKPVYDAVVDHLALELDMGGYEAAALATAKSSKFYENASELINCGTAEVSYIENATRAWDMAFYSVPFKPGDRILTHESEYSSNYLAFIQRAQQLGFHIDIVPSDPTGQIDVGALTDMIKPRTRLIAITHVPTFGGLVNPVEEVGKVAREHGITYLLDACQSVGQMPIDVESIGCDMLSATGRKFLRGPRGTGFLYVRQGLARTLEPPFVDLHAAEWSAVDGYDLRPDGRRFESWESFVAGRIGLSAAFRYALDIGLVEISARITELSKRLREGLSSIPGVALHDAGTTLCGITTFTRRDEPASQIAARLRQHSACVSVTRDPSRRFFGNGEVVEMVRASIHYYNTASEVDAFCRIVAGKPTPACTSPQKELDRSDLGVG